MSDLIQSVTNGTLDPTTNNTKSTVGTDSLGKDAFLQLLVTQMKYQDPLNPNTDTQFVAQLATFSQLEQMQNMNQTTTNSQAFGLVGKDVIVKSTNTSGNVAYKSGTVDYVTVSNGKAQLNIEGNLYSLDQLHQVIDSTYLIKQGLPTIKDKVEKTYDKTKPENISFDVNLGSGETIATEIAIAIDKDAIDSKYVSLSNNTVTISKDALSKLEEGKHKVTVVFNDALYTAVSDKVTITVVGSSAEDTTSTEENSSNQEDASTEGDSTV